MLRIRKIREVMVVKDNIHLTYKYKNRNQAFKQVENLQDKIINHVIDDVLFGNVGELKNIEKTISKIINDTLVNERKRIHRIDDRFVNHAVKSNTEIYSKFFNNRLNNIKYSLQLRIEEELRKNSIRNLSDSEIRKILSEKYADTGKARLKNIVKDSIHTNESNISFIQALNEGYSYKVWMNGRSKGKTRPWHRARIIASVPIDEYFDIYGSYPAELMYPGDLNGGAENVANCRCWLRYTNRVPSNLKKKSSFNIPPSSYLHGRNKGSVKQNGLRVNSKSGNKITRTISTIGNKIKNTGSKITEKVKQTKISINHFKNNIKSKIVEKEVQRLMKQYKSYELEFERDLIGTRNKLLELYSIPDNLKSCEVEKLVEYGIDSSWLMEYMRKTRLFSYNEIKYFEDYLFNLNNGINKYDNLKVPTKLDRRVNDDFFIVDVGKIGVFETPVSTTFNPSLNKKFGEFHISILAPIGTNGAYIEGIMQKENFSPHLDEWVLLNNMKYKTLYKNYNSKEAVILIVKKHFFKRENPWFIKENIKLIKMN